MSKERALLRRVKVLLECSNMEPLQRQTDLIIGEIKELLAQPEEGVYQKILRIEDGIEVEILPSELWMDGYETGRKYPQKREPLTGIEITNGFKSYDDVTHPYSYWAGVIFAEEHHGIGGGE